MEEFIVTSAADEVSPFEGKMPWDERARRIRQMYPSTARLDWEAAFRVDPLVMSRIIQDMYKHEAEPTGRPGKRPAASPEDAAQYLKRYQNEDYTILNFKEAFKVLKGDRSFRAMGHKCGLAHAMVQRLLDGRTQPTAEIMEQVAKAFKKHPSYFLEYRIAYIVAVLSYRMEAIPESSIVPYMKLKGDYDKEL